MLKREINLLPAGKQRTREYRALVLGIGRFLRWIYAALGVMAFSLVLILAAVVSIQELVVGGKGGNSSTVVLEGRANETNELVRYVEDRINEYSPWSERVAEIIGVMPATVQIKALSKVDAKEVIELTGFTADRPAIKEFQTRLEGLAWVGSIEAPLKNFTIGTSQEFFLKIMMEGNEDGS